MRILLACLLVLLMPEWDVDAQFGRRRRGPIERMERDIFPGNTFTFCQQLSNAEFYGR